MIGPVDQPVDGRDARWRTHREERRLQLTESTLRLIRRHGAGVGMEEIATEAGTSKTVIYRHLGDRLSLYLAVCASVDRLILKHIDAVLTGVDPRLQPTTPGRCSSRSSTVTWPWSRRTPRSAAS